MRATILIAFVALTLVSCGKRPRNLEPPTSKAEDQRVYPKRYPPPDQPGERY